MIPRTKMIQRTKMIVWTKMIARILLTVCNPFVCFIRNCLNNYLLLFRCCHSKPLLIPVADTKEQRKFFQLNLHSQLMLYFYSLFMQGSIIVFMQPLKDDIHLSEPRMWQSTMILQPMIAQLVNIAIPYDGVSILCSAYVHGTNNPAHYARNLARQQQAEEAERGQHLEKQLICAIGF
jgi:hypothetical protein